jgi:P-type E1-E2 ATPase
MTPESKRTTIHDRRAKERTPVAFVGDGVNDSLALAEADLGITVAGGSDLAHASGQVSLLDGNLHRLVQLLRAARIARRRIALSLTWSFGYNSIGITLAAMGVLTPVFAAIAMVLSSAVTIAIASRPLDFDDPANVNDTRASVAPSPQAHPEVRPA